MRLVCVHSKGRMNFCQHRPACKCTKCMAFYNKDGTWNEAWASWSVSKPFSQHLLLSNDNLSYPCLTLHQTSQRFLAVLFMHYDVQFTPSPLSALLPVRNPIFNSLFCLLRMYCSLKRSLILCAPAKPAKIYGLIG
jgi:hypothetical protein